MGDIGGGDANGVVMEERPVYMNPDPSSISEDYWAVAEETTLEIVNAIHPTMDSEEKRKDVIDYIQRLFSSSLGLEVLFFWAFFPLYLLLHVYCFLRIFFVKFNFLCNICGPFSV